MRPAKMSIAETLVDGRGMHFPQFWLSRVLTILFLHYPGQAVLPTRNNSGILALREVPLQSSKTVLIVDDDPSHLKLYSWVLERGGFNPITALVQGDNVDLPEQHGIDVAVLDYRLGPMLTAADVARRLRSESPSMPIVVLSDLPWMPEDVAPFASGFVRKGDPQQLIEVVGAIIGESPDDAASDSRVV